MQQESWVGIAGQAQPFIKRESPLQLPVGNLFKRALTAKVLAQLNRCSVLEIAEQRWPSDRALATVLKATSAPAMTTVTGWAKELVTTHVAEEAADALGAASAAGVVLQNCLTLSWDGAGILSVPSMAAAAANASFVQEGSPIPVRQLLLTPALINPYKIAVIAALSREMMESSNAEALISDCLVDSCALALDTVLFGTAAATAAQPAGLRNGIGATTASNSTDLIEAFAEDLAALLNVVGAVGGTGPYILVSSIGRWGSMRLRFVQEDPNLIVVPSLAVGNDLVMIAANAVAAALSPDPVVEAANTATLVMDTAPVPPGTTGPERSVFQTDSFAVKVRWPVSWVLRDVRGVAWLTPAWK